MQLTPQKDQTRCRTVVLPRCVWLNKPRSFHLFEITVICGGMCSGGSLCFFFVIYTLLFTGCFGMIHRFLSLFAFHVFPPHMDFVEADASFAALLPISFLWQGNILVENRIVWAIRLCCWTCSTSHPQENQDLRRFHINTHKARPESFRSFVFCQA